MAKNEFLPFGIAEGANVLSNQEYERLAARFNGFISGVAKSKELNTVWRQSSVMSSALAQFIVDSDNQDLLDNGDVAGVKNRLVFAIKQTISGIGYVTTAAMNLELNKKIDKANISGQKGNDNDKVPSLNLMTNELGILSTQNKNLSERITTAQNTANQANKAASSAQKDAASANDNAELRALKTTKVNGYPLTNNVFLTTKDIFKNMTDLGSDNLSTIFSPGIYYQKTNASALWSRNYPKDGVGGVLIVYRTNQGATITNNACVQVYYSNENITYTRVYNGSSWVGGWASQLNTANTTVDRNGYLKVSNSSAVSDCPVGAPIPWPQSTAPSGFLVCNGQSFNKITYPLLATAYPSGVLPDLRAEFIRGLDAGRNVDSERVVLSEQSDAIRNITGSMKFSEMIGGIPSDGAFYVSSNPSVPKTFHSSGGGTSPTISFDPSRVVPTANENRPRNIAFLYIVRAA